jgi:hypothetical protein
VELTERPALTVLIDIPVNKVAAVALAASRALKQSKRDLSLRHAINYDN